ncbi:MAG: anthranilate synthase component I family protein [Bacteroidales bacterium]|jgi:anthranilate synthase component 1|nr:anthranilate synthase component I family protein [Bacteroidales bacterium]
MKKIKIKTIVEKMLADTVTPVSIYLKLRDVFPGSILLESSDYRGNENSYSFICLKPLATIEVTGGMITETYPGADVKKTAISDGKTLKERFEAFLGSFDLSEATGEVTVNGLFGYTSYDAVRYFEKVDLKSQDDEKFSIPDMRYSFYNFIIGVDHFRNVLYLTENRSDSSSEDAERIKSLINSRNIAEYPFSPDGPEESAMSDEEYRKNVSAGKHHCHIGDVFQVVMSRRYSRSFTGDEFNVYRALRSINPSPYLFYFDYGSYRIFGSSPEAHLKIKKRVASINPIAGTFRRTGDDERDRALAAELANDKKENAEHVMLVDLARNDLSRHAINVKVNTFREVQFYSHVIHLVSMVSGEMIEGSSVVDVMSSTFPAGTLSGAPKIKAMQIIDSYEPLRRGYYGGAIGFIDFNGDFNHAIMIRTFLSKAGRLCYQAGAGIVAESDEEKELQEVDNKLGALRRAIENARDI